MKCIICLIAIMCAIQVRLIAQKKDPIRFTFSVQPVKGNDYELYLTPVIEPGWYIYAQTQPAATIAQPTKFIFSKNPLLVLTGLPAETGDKDIYDDKTAGIVQYQCAKVDFVQAFLLKALVKMNITGSVTYQECTYEMCLPPKTVSFNLPVQ